MNHSRLSPRWPYWAYFLFTTLAVLMLISSGQAQTTKAPPLLREARAAWIASVHNLTWPTSPGLSASAQQAQLIRQLDTAQSLGLNIIILQVRPSCDALYDSPIEPWSPFLSRGSPGYDPLRFAIREAHARGLELHAWINPFRATTSAQYVAGPKHVVRRHPEWTRPFAGQLWLDPGEPAVRDYTLRVVQDLVSRYDLDGLHIDDYFYPYPKSDGLHVTASPFPDDETYARYGRGADRAAWRRGNINTFVKALYATVKNEKPWVKVGISPFGIWKPRVPRTIEARLDATEWLAADSRQWLASGWCDYFMPQLYWRIQPPEQSYTTLLDWWVNQSRGRYVWPGMAADRILSRTDPGRPASEIVAQIESARQLIPRGTSGHAHWHLRSLIENRGGIAATLKKDTYARKAVVPSMPWLDRSAPAAPKPAGMTPRGENKLIQWSSRDRSARWWVVQGFDGKSWEILHILPATTQEALVPATLKNIAIRGLGPAGVEGDPLYDH
jgi:uncharacterized lipoprotein YddW (UPF0748 family)